MRMDPCADCGERVNINSDHRPGCPKRQLSVWHDEPPVDPRVSAYAKEHSLDEKVLDWHLEAIHGWEGHNPGYEEAIEQAAECLANGGCR